MLCGFMALYHYQGPLAPGLNFVKNSLTYFYSLFISSSALHLIAERLANVTAYTSFKVFGLTRLRIEPSLPASCCIEMMESVKTVKALGNFNH